MRAAGSDEAIIIRFFLRMLPNYHASSMAFPISAHLAVLVAVDAAEWSIAILRDSSFKWPVIQSVSEMMQTAQHAQVTSHRWPTADRCANYDPERLFFTSKEKRWKCDAMKELWQHGKSISKTMMRLQGAIATFAGQESRGTPSSRGSDHCLLE